MGIFSIIGNFVCRAFYVFFGKKVSEKKQRYGPYDFSNKTDLEKLGIFISKNDKALDYRRTLKENETDSMLVFGTNTNKDYFLARVSVNAQGHATTWFDLWLSDGRTFHKSENVVHNAPVTTEDSFVAGGLRMRCLWPLRKWKISYNGTLREKDKNGITKEVHARLSLIWTTYATPHDLKSDITSTDWDEFCSELSDPSKAANVFDDLENVVQGGSLMGSINIDGEEIELSLWGSRKRSTEINKPNSPDHFEIMLNTFEGQAFHVGHLTFPNLKPILKYAYVVVKNSAFCYISKAKMTFTDDDIKRISMSSELWNFDLNFDEPSIDVCYPVLETDYGVQIKFVPVTTNDDAGIALVLKHSRAFGHCNFSMQKPSLSLPKLVQSSNRKLVVALDEIDCRNTSLTGGKGSSLGCLNYVKENINSEYSVPMGFVVTTEAYKMFGYVINIDGEVKKVETVAWGNKSNEEIEDVCKSVTAYISAQDLPPGVFLAVKNQMEEMFSNELQGKRFAVRSSASGEDSEELSAAGQMQTFLGVSNMNEVMKAIAGCWASQFSFTAIQYKRQNGQLLNSPMAVVVQEMVPSDMAGVLFTCNPMTGNPKEVSLTANYGLGESVVSASADPDTVIFERSDDNILCFKSTTIGGKASHIVMTDDGVEDLPLENSKRETCCLSVKLAGDLSRIAVKIEEVYGCPLDIEWAISGEEIYLLQARPITTFDQDSNNYLELECHSPARHGGEFYSRANIGEVMAGSMSPLGMLGWNSLMCIHAYRHSSKRDPNIFNFDPFSIVMGCNYYFQGFFNLGDSIFRFYRKGEKSIITESMMIAIFGRLLYDKENDEMFDVMERRNKFNTPLSSFWATYYLLTDIIFCRSRVISDTKKVRQKSIELKESSSAAEMLGTTILQYCNTPEVSNRHMECSMTTSLVNCAVMYILVSSSGEWSTKVFNDLARILSSCPDVESADVPAAIEELAHVIIGSSSKESFPKMSREEALNWLLHTEDESGTMFKDFLKKHGHRCVNEFDVHIQPWGINPLPLVEILQDIVKKTGDSKKAKKKIVTISEVLSGLSIPLKWRHRMILRFLIPLSRRGVGCRELSKSLMVYGVSLLRQAYVKVSNKMVLEGRLPEADLFYYLTLYELGLLFETRSPKLIQKAIRRRALFPKMNNYKFPDIAKGFPKPINKVPRLDTPVEASFTMKGTPVSEGFIQARCRVALSLEDAKQIQPGEILIAYGTDIGWSPYFPMLSGVATELGGLISHGAVIAREYGLPCVVGVHGATERFRSGDLVVLDGTKGFLQKIEE